MKSQPVSIRLPLPLYELLLESCRASGRNMSDEIAELIARGLEWQDAFARGRIVVVVDAPWPNCVAADEDRREVA